MSSEGAIDISAVRDPATDAETVVERHSDILEQWADRDDKIGAIARATLRAGRDDD